MDCRQINCTCIVSEDEGYCSTYCARAADEMEIGAGDEDEDGGLVADCGCGHPACEGTAAAAL
ncbi:MAG: hypothetical protein ACRDWH_06710 [Acidimicrobiia bacterium]